MNSIFLIVLAPFFGALWIKLAARQPSTPAKMGFGLVFLAVGFLVLAWGASFTANGARVSMMWLIGTYFLHTVGELCLSPVGLSSVTKLAPKSLVGQLMGTWFMGTALGNLIAGLAAGGFAGMGITELFTSVAKVTGVAGIVLLIFAKPIRRLVGGAEDNARNPRRPSRRPAAREGNAPVLQAAPTRAELPFRPQNFATSAADVIVSVFFFPGTGSFNVSQA